MQAKYVIITELKSDKTKNGKQYTWFYDQDKFRWNCFDNENVELNKSYVLRFEQEGDYLNIKQLEPLVNVFHDKALKEIANRSDYKRDIFMSISYAKDLIVGGMLDPDDLFTFAEKIYNEANSLTDKYMPKGEVK